MMDCCVKFVVSLGFVTWWRRCLPVATAPLLGELGALQQ
jgi:hypothetical protein